MSSYIRPVKSLGQHFLKDLSVAVKTAQALSESAQRMKVLEIGPGTGVLTTALLDSGINDLYCIEIDDRSVSYLKHHFPSLHDRIIHSDFLKSDLSFLGEEPFIVVGNFPYNISSQILFRVLDNYKRIPELAGMFQKEVALRIAAPPGGRTYGILSVLLQAHYEIEYLFTVPPEAFTPPPKVESAVLRLRLRKNPDLNCDPVLFRKLVKTAFNQRRKTLRNSIKSLLPGNTNDFPYLTLRPEQLSYSQFEELTNLIHAANS